MTQKPDVPLNRKNIDTIRDVLHRLEQLAAVGTQETPDKPGSPPLKAVDNEKPPPLPNVPPHVRSVELTLVRSGADARPDAKPNWKGAQHGAPPPASPEAESQLATLSRGPAAWRDGEQQARLRSEINPAHSDIISGAPKPASNHRLRPILISGACIFMGLAIFYFYSIKATVTLASLGGAFADLVKPTGKGRSNEATPHHLARPAAAERITSLGAPTPDSTTLHLVDEVVTAEEELETVFPIHIEPAGRADAESRLVFVRNVPNGARLSKGQSDSSGNWKLASDQLRDLKLFMPPGSASSTRMKIALLTPKGVELSNAHMTVVIRPHEPAPPSDDEKHPSKLSQANDPVDVEARVDIYLQRGNEFLANGNVASAREFYRRAANAESAQGALALGATYDPNYFDRLGIQGMLADPEMARKWYDRAAELGSKDAIDRISILEGRQFESPQAK